MYAGLNSSSVLKSFFKKNPRTNKARASDGAVASPALR